MPRTNVPQTNGYYILHTHEPQAGPPGTPYFITNETIGSLALPTLRAISAENGQQIAYLTVTGGEAWCRSYGVYMGGADHLTFNGWRLHCVGGADNEYGWRSGGFKTLSMSNSIIENPSDSADPKDCFRVYGCEEWAVIRNTIFIGGGLNLGGGFDASHLNFLRASNMLFEGCTFDFRWTISIRPMSLYGGCRNIVFRRCIFANNTPFNLCTVVPPMLTYQSGVPWVPLPDPTARSVQYRFIDCIVVRPGVYRRLSINQDIFNDNNYPGGRDFAEVTFTPETATARAV